MHADLNDETGPRRKSLLSRSFRSVRLTLFSSLTRRIVFLNLAALAVLLATILYMNQFREGLIDSKIESLLTQGRIIASAIAGSATASPDAITIDPEKLLELKAGESLQPRLDPLVNFRYPINPEQVAPVLQALIKPTHTRARIYDPDGILTLDSRNLYAGGQILRYDLPAIGETEDIWSSKYLGYLLNRLLQREELPVYRDLTGPGTQYPEVQAALTGAPTPIVRQTVDGKLTVSVAVPIQRFRAVLGVLLLSTEGDDIDRIVREERLAILRIFLVAAIVTFVLSALLASTIASPLRKLSEAAKRVKRGVKSRVSIPDFSARQDEVGNLSVSIRDMTESLYQRIEAIESFAADVSHELKNPLTSLRSAVETLPLAKTDDSRKRLLDVIQHDVKRLDRLITDISDASRLDADLVRDHAETIDLAELVNNIVEASREVRRHKKSAEIECKVLRTGFGKRGYPVAGHDTRLGQVINNLIDNAASFVPESKGKVSIELQRDAKSIFLTVEDNGPGVQAENVDRIFERFYTDRPESEGFGQNSGLGLSISRQIIEAHAGTITVKNRTDGQTGARFTVVLPADDKNG
ncbi:MAG: stimulus-sensing domain-containing protein [Rhizobiaceae bacterium]|nr:stimulus-sensing domain-containing protein [Rhizobiaceae bacterium]